jgi:hypothetical protein
MGREFLSETASTFRHLATPSTASATINNSKGVDSYKIGVYVFFPLFIVKANTATNCHLSYKLIGLSCNLLSLNYIQPKSPNNSASAGTSIPSVPAVVVDEGNDNNTLPTYLGHWPKRLPSPPQIVYGLSRLPPPVFFVSLKDLDCNELISRPYMANLHRNVCVDQPPTTSTPAACNKEDNAQAKLECMPLSNISTHLHHPNTYLPPICLHDTPNASDNESTFTPEELCLVKGWQLKTRYTIEDYFKL